MPRSPSPDANGSTIARYLSTLTGTLIDHLMRMAEKINQSVRLDGKATMTAPLPLLAVAVADLTGDLDATLWPYGVVALTDGTAPMAISDGAVWLYPDGSAV